MDKQKQIEEITDKDELELSKSFQEMVMEAVKHAFKEGIKANSIIINKDFVMVKKAWINNGFSYSELPDMICGLEVYLTDDELPDNYSFAVLERDKTERELLIERTRQETAEKFAERLKHRLDNDCDIVYKDRSYSCIYGFERKECFETIDEICKELGGEL